MLYWLYYYFNRHVGESVLDMEGTAPFYEPKDHRFSGPPTPTLITLSKDGRIVYLTVGNGSWTRAVPCLVHLRNFHAGRLEGMVLTNDNLDAKPLLDEKKDLVSPFPVTATPDGVTCTIPPHAVVFVTMTQK
jgi:hypothetical protein